MIYTHRFVCDPDGRWYIDLPTFPGPRAELEMVYGADTLLNLLAQGDADVHVTFSDMLFDNSSLLVKVKDGADEGGAYYWVDNVNGIDYGFEIWLCDVTKFVFGVDVLPNTIYFS